MFILFRSILVFFVALVILIMVSMAVGQQREYPPLVYIAKTNTQDEIRLLDINTGFWVKVAQHDSFGAVDVSPQGDILVTTHAAVGSILNTLSPNMTEIVYGTDDNPTWSPAADRIAYRRYYYQGGLYVYTVGRWPPRPLHILATAITWSPDGRSLAYSRWNEISDQEEIRTIDIITREDTLVVGWRKPVRHMRWSPDGSQIALTTIAGEFHLYDLATGQFTQRLVDTSNVRSAQWSPDGKYLGVISTRRGVSTLNVFTPAQAEPVQFALDDLNRVSSFDWWSAK